MAITDLFSKRQKKRRGEVEDVYQYTEIPLTLRAQVVHIWRDALGHAHRNREDVAHFIFEAIHKTLCREYGVFRLTMDTGQFREFDDLVIDFLMTEQNHERVLDVIELSFQHIGRALKNPHVKNLLPQQISADGAIAELNTRFREHGVGYQLEGGELIRVDSQFIHSEVVKPVLTLLATKHYAGANAEFLKAFEHYRKGDTKECLNECLKAFESTMKAICTKRGWTFKPTDTASALVDVCFKNHLIPVLIQSHITGVRTALESGIPTIRNKLSGHGQGVQVVEVPLHYASYMLHLTATTIKFLVEAEKEMKQ